MDMVVSNARSFFPFAPERPLRARYRGICPIEFLFCTRADLVQFRMQPSDLGIQFDKVQARSANQLARRDPCVVRAATRFHLYAGGWLLGSRIALQIRQIET